LLATIEFDKKAVSRGEQIVVRRSIVRPMRDTTGEFSDQL